MSEKPISYEEAVETIFAPWFSGESLSAGDRVATPREAAARAILAALNTNGERGRIRVLVQTAEAKKACRNYLDAFLLDEPRLKKLVQKMGPELITLHGGITLQIDTNDVRLAKDALATIVLDTTVDTPIAFRMTHPERRPGGPTYQECTQEHHDREKELILDEMVAAGEIREDQRNQVRFFRWQLWSGKHDQPQLGPDGQPTEPGPNEPGGALLRVEEAVVTAEQQLEERLAKRAREQEAEAKYHAAVEQRRREETAEKIHDHFAKLKQTGV